MKFKSTKLRMTYTVICTLVIAAGFSGCKKKEAAPGPQACFTSDKDKALVGDIVTFSNCTSNANHYEWDFGDGTYATIDAPSKVYTAAGTYKIRMTAFGDNGQSNATKNILVGYPYVDKVVINSININSSTPIDSIQVYFNNGSVPDANAVKPAFPLTLPISRLYPVGFGVQNACVVFVYYGRSYYYETITFTPDKYSNVSHGTEHNGDINMDVYWKIQ